MTILTNLMMPKMTTQPLCALMVTMAAVLFAANGCTAQERAAEVEGAATGYYRKAVLTAPQPPYSLMAKLAVSSDQRLIAASNRGKGLLTVWDVQTGAVVMQKRITASGGGIAFTPDGRYLITDPVTVPTAENRILASVLDPRTGMAVTDLPLPKEVTLFPRDVIVRWAPEKIAVNPAGTEAAIVTCRDVFLYDIHTWKPTQPWGTDKDDGCITAVAYGRDGTLIRGTGRGLVQKLDRKTMSSENRFVAHSDAVGAVAFTPEGNLITTSMRILQRYEQGVPIPLEREIIKLWPNAQPPLGGSMPAEVGIKFFGIAISSDGKTIAAASMPPTVIELCQPKNLSSQYGGIELRQIPFDVASVGDCFAFLEVSDIELWCRRGAM